MCDIISSGKPLAAKIRSNCVNNVLDFVELTIATSGKRVDQSFTSGNCSPLILDHRVHLAFQFVEAVLMGRAFPQLDMLDTILMFPELTHAFQRTTLFHRAEHLF